MEQTIFRNCRLVYVNGLAIRNTLDDDFGIIHRRSVELSHFAPKFYIPENEIWIDAPYRDETELLLKIEFFADDHQLDEAISYQAERQLMREKLCLVDPLPELVKRSERLGDLKIVYVDGRLVREYLDPEFILGGHDLVYDYIPAKEIWLDAKMDPAESPYLLEHERVERELMVGGKSYDSAHDFAIAADKELRRRDGIGHYPSESGYPFRGWSNEKIITTQYYV
ncbi:MAG: hypothetical protein AAB415_00285 [Patescibacteria group bacterium]